MEDDKNKDAPLHDGQCDLCDETPEAVVTGSDGTRVCVECHADGEA